MLTFNKLNYLKIKKPKITKKKKRYLRSITKVSSSFVSSNFKIPPIFSWASSKFFILKIKYTISSKLKNYVRFKKFNLNQNELFSLKLIINNFCSNGKFLRYYVMFSEIFLNLKSQLLWRRNNDKLSPKGLDNLLFVLKFFKNNFFLYIKTHFLHLLFSKYELVFFAKAIQLNKRVARKKKKKYLLGFDYVNPTRRFARLVKFWKYYLNYSSKSVFKRKLFKGIFQLVVNYKKSILVKYRKKIITSLVRTKKLQY